MKKKKNIIKYTINEKNRMGTIVLTIILSLVYVLCLFLDNSDIISLIFSNYEKSDLLTSILLQVFPVAKDVLLVILSILISGIISTYLIDVKEKNNLYSELIVNDIFASPEVYEKFSDENKEKILKNLEQEIYFNGSKLSKEMYSSVRKKINTNLKNEQIEFFYDKCKFDITCKIYDEYIEKTIIKTVELKSFGKTCKINNYRILTNSSKKIGDKKTIELKRFEINSKDASKHIIESEEKSSNALMKKCGYNQTKILAYKKDINLRSDNSTKVEIEYISRVPRDDITYACRLFYPCKKFSLNFTISEINDSCLYSLNTFAFGFIDDGNGSQNLTSENKRVCVEFEDWIFPCDGVAVVLNRKNE